jgi:hypothetical protein
LTQPESESGVSTTVISSVHRYAVSLSRWFSKASLLWFTSLMHVHRPFLQLHLICSATLVLSVAASATGIDIVTTYDRPLSQPPLFDADAEHLTALVESAARMYEDIIEDKWTIDLAFTWGDLGDAGTLGLATTRATDQGKPTVARMRFNTNETVNWFIDTTPNDHREYALRQTLVRDLTNADRRDAFTGDPPDVMEVGFGGPSLSASNSTDLYSVILHELGHVLGLSSPVIAGEADDGDFDVPSDFLGVAAGIQVATEDRAHLAASSTAMFPMVTPDIRRLPSATDVLAIATSAGWKEIDLPRQDFLTGDAWHTRGNWEGNSVPDADDDVYLRHGGNVLFDAPSAAKSVSVADETQLNLRANLSAQQIRIENATLRVEEQLTVDSFSADQDSFVQTVLTNQFRGIEVSGTASIDGILVIDVPEGLEDFTIGSEFVLLKAQSIQGAFVGIQGVRLNSSLRLAIDSLPDRITGTVALMGDVNLDGIVNFRDFMILTNNFGSATTSWRRGNFDGDAAVNFGDFVGLARSFGNQVELGKLSATNVAEPSGSPVLLFIAVLLAIRGQRFAFHQA